MDLKPAAPEGLTVVFVIPFHSRDLSTAEVLVFGMGLLEPKPQVCRWVTLPTF